MMMLFLLFLIIVFLAGLYVYAFSNGGVIILPIQKENMETMEAANVASCPDLLIKKDCSLLLYNTKLPEVDGLNPIPFFSMDEYLNYLEIQKRKGIHCPVLFLQQESDTQGQDVYRIRPSPTNTEPGMQPITLAPPQVVSGGGAPKPLQTIQYIDSSREDPPFNGGQYSGFDPYGLFIGKYTNIDAIHDSTEKQQISDNPMDPNWGGTEYTQAVVNSGKYDEYNITRPTNYTPKNNSFIPGLGNMPPPPSTIDFTSSTKSFPIGSQLLSGDSVNTNTINTSSPVAPAGANFKYGDSASNNGSLFGSSSGVIGSGSQ